MVAAGLSRDAVLHAMLRDGFTRKMVRRSGLFGPSAEFASPSELRIRLSAFFTVYDTTRLGEVDEVLAQSGADPQRMFEGLDGEYALRPGNAFGCADLLGLRTTAPPPRLSSRSSGRARGGGGGGAGRDSATRRASRAAAARRRSSANVVKARLTGWAARIFEGKATHAESNAGHESFDERGDVLRRASRESGPAKYRPKDVRDLLARMSSARTFDEDDDDDDDEADGELWGVAAPPLSSTAAASGGSRAAVLAAEQRAAVSAQKGELARNVLLSSFCSAGGAGGERGSALPSLLMLRGDGEGRSGCGDDDDDWQ